MLKNEASQFARELEHIGHCALDQCRGLPDEALRWPLPVAQPYSLLTLGLQLAHTIDFWIVMQIGEGQSLLENKSIDTYAGLCACYHVWIKQTHQILDELPDAYLNLYIGRRACKEKLPTLCRGAAPAVRTCLLTAVARSAEYLGHISCTRTLFEDGYRLFAEKEIDRFEYSVPWSGRSIGMLPRAID